MKPLLGSSISGTKCDRDNQIVITHKIRTEYIKCRSTLPKAGMSVEAKLTTPKLNTK